MSWFKKEVKKTADEIAKENADYIFKRESQYLTIRSHFSPYIKTYCMDKNGSVYIFDDIIYDKDSDEIHFNTINNTTPKDCVTYWNDKTMNSNNLLEKIRKDRERFITLRNQLNYFELEITKKSDGKSLERDKKIDNILGSV